MTTIEFDDDPDRAICDSYMNAQHLTESSEARTCFLLRGSYTNHMVRTAKGWRIANLIQHVSWSQSDELRA